MKHGAGHHLCCNDELIDAQAPRQLYERSYNDTPLGLIRNSSRVLPSFNALVSHRGFSPRPLHVVPFGPWYFGAIFLRWPLSERAAPFVLLWTALPLSRLSSFSKSSARLSSSAAISSRNLQRASLERVVREDFFGCIFRPHRQKLPGQI